MVQQENKNSNFTFSTFVKIFLSNKKTIIITFIVSAILSSILAFFVMDKIYYSAGVIKTTGGASGLSSLLSGGAIPDISGLGDIAAGGGSASELALYENILNSRRCVESTIIKFNIMEEEGYENMHFAVKYFKEDVMTISSDKIAGTMEIGVFDKDPVKAKEIADYLINQLNKINVELKVQDAKNNREFLEERYNLVKNDLKRAEDSLRYYQDVYGIAPEITVQAAVQSQVEIEAQIKSEEVKLQLLKKILTSNQPEIKAQEEKISALREQLSGIINTQNPSSTLSLKGTPAVVMNFLRLKRNVEIQNNILAFLIPLYEQAKVEENRNTPSLLIVDSPFIPDYKTKPKRSIVILLLTMFATLSVYSFFVLKIKWKEFKHHI